MRSLIRENLKNQRHLRSLKNINALKNIMFRRKIINERAKYERVRKGETCLPAGRYEIEIRKSVSAKLVGRIC